MKLGVAIEKTQSFVSFPSVDGLFKHFLCTSFKSRLKKYFSSPGTSNVLLSLLVIHVFGRFTFFLDYRYLSYVFSSKWLIYLSCFLISFFSFFKNVFKNIIYLFDYFPLAKLSLFIKSYILEKKSHLRKDKFKYLKFN